MYIESAAASLLRQWRGNSGIVEAFAEHDSRFQRFLGNGLPKGSRSTFYIHFVELTSTNFYTLKVEMMRREMKMNVKWEFQRQSDGEEKGDFHHLPLFCSRSDCRNPAHGFLEGKRFREEHPLRG